MPQKIEIRRAFSVDDYLACQEAQRRAWGITDESYVVPLATLVGANLHGGLVLGAFTPEGRAVGVSFAFLGRVEGRLCLYSQLTGVVPGQQGQGLGGRLKQFQREYARTQGIPSLAWSFDPLQAGNAWFNLDRLGATAAHYHPDMYGRRTDALNAGAATDRLIVEWASDPQSPPRERPGAVSGLPRWVHVRQRDDGLIEPVGVAEPPLEGPSALLEIPLEIAELRRSEPALAEAWTLAVRWAFVEGFAAGYRAEGFVRDASEGRPRGFYLMNRPG